MAKFEGLTIQFFPEKLSLKRQPQLNLDMRSRFRIVAITNRRSFLSGTLKHSPKSPVKTKWKSLCVRCGLYLTEVWACNCLKPLQYRAKICILFNGPFYLIPARSTGWDIVRGRKMHHLQLSVRLFNTGARIETGASIFNYAARSRWQISLRFWSVVDSW